MLPLKVLKDYLRVALKDLLHCAPAIPIAYSLLPIASERTLGVSSYISTNQKLRGYTSKTSR